MTSPIPAITFWPQCQRGKIGRLADRRPCEQRRLLLRGKIDQQPPIRRKIAASLVDAPLEPLAAFKLVFPQIPFDELHLRRRTAAKNHPRARLAGKKYPDSGVVSC